MNLIVDANVLFAALIKDGATAKLFFVDGIHLYAPEYLHEEFEEYRSEILKKTHRTSTQFEEALSELSGRIHFVPVDEFESAIKDAEQISPDIDDAIYFALALKFEMPIWSNDARLKNQSAVRVYSTSDLLNIYSTKLGG
jgi:predicted nucleic acid-binding protein